MCRNFVCGLLAVAAACLAVACGGGDPGGSSGNITGPGTTPPVTTAPPPASGVANISGSWGGRFGFEQNNAKQFSDVTTTIAQSDRRVEGTLRFTSPGWEQWTATFSGRSEEH